MAAINGTERYVKVFSSAAHVFNDKIQVFGVFLMLDILMKFSFFSCEQKRYYSYTKTIVLIDLTFSTFPFVYIRRILGAIC